VDQKEAKIEERRRIFNAVVKASGLKNMADLAKKLGVVQSTLTNIQKCRLPASPKLIEAMKKLARGVPDIDIDSLAVKTVDNSVEPTSNAPPSIGQRLIQYYSQRLETLRKAQNDDQNIEDIRQNFDALNRDDVFVYISAKTTPLEMKQGQDKSKLKEAIARAIQRQAFFLYLVPTEKNPYVKDYINYTPLFKDFKKKIREIVGATISDESLQDRCVQRLLLIQTDENFLFRFPNFKWDLFYSDTIDLPYHAKAGVLAAAGLAEKEEDVVGTPTPLSDEETKTVLFEVARAVYLANLDLTEPDRVPSSIVERLKDSAEMATGKKIGPSESNLLTSIILLALLRASSSAEGGGGSYWT
jgi:hypothetical protein